MQGSLVGVWRVGFWVEDVARRERASTASSGSTEMSRTTHTLKGLEVRFRGLEMRGEGLRLGIRGLGLVLRA